MAVKVFNRQGLRRDFNLSDLTDPQSALNNILATPTMLGTEESFTVTDLLPIQQIYVTNITAATFASLDGVTVSFTVVENGVIDNTTNPRVYRPLIKIKNRLDTAYFSTGEPFFFGGDGPNATYYDSDKIIRDPDSLVYNEYYAGGEIVLSGPSNTYLYRALPEAYRELSQGPLTHTEGESGGFRYVQVWNPQELYLSRAFDNVTLEDVTIQDSFWERGQFEFGNKVQNSFISLFGGVNWQGFFKPVTSGFSRFFLRTTGATVFKFQDPSEPSFTEIRYGQVNNTQFNNDLNLLTLGNQVNKQRIADAFADTTRTFVEVSLTDNITIRDGDFIYLEINEGPVIPKQYQIFAYFEEPTPYNKFFIEVTVDFNLQNIDVATLPTNPDASLSAGYKGYARYSAYDRRQLKTYLNTMFHKLTVPVSAFTPTGVNTLQVTDQFIYNHLMINDYLYDYRTRFGESVPVARRWTITGLNDTNNTVTVLLDAQYAINTGNLNDQQAYYGLDNIVNFNAGTEINATGTTGNINDLIDTGTYASESLLYVGRYGESVPREKTILIEQFLENYVDYAFDWVYFTKDEDIDPATQNKAWILRYRSETSGSFGTLNYKYLYDKNYKFYEIGDFKVFLDNSVGLGGTSREEGIDQRAFGAKQLLSKGDQYNQLYTLLPLRSDYTPKENWNQVALSRALTYRDNSRLLGIGNTTDVEVGNFVVADSTTGFQSGTALPLKSRIIEVNEANANVVISKTMTANGSANGWVFNHRGFVTYGVLQWDSTESEVLTFLGDKGEEIQVGMCVVLKDKPNESTYIRVTRVDYDAPSDTYKLRFDRGAQTLVPGAGTLYGDPNQYNAINGVDSTGYWSGILPANADYDYGSPGAGEEATGTLADIFDNSLSTWVYWTGGVEYSQGNIAQADFDLRDFASATAGGSGTGITQVRVYGGNPFSSGYVAYRMQLLDSNKNAISGTTTTFGGVGNYYINPTGAAQTNARYVRFTPTAEYPSAYPRHYMYSMWINGTQLINGGTGTATELAAFYYDKGVDITKPLESFCTGTSCGQSRYNIEKNLVETNHIGLFIGSGVIGGNDVRFTSPGNGARTYINNGNAQIAEWREYQPNVQTELNFTAKTYRSNAIYVKFAGTDLENSFADLGHPNFPVNSYVPVGYIAGMVRIRGEIYDGTYGLDTTVTVAGGYTGSVANNGTFTVRLTWASVTDPDQMDVQFGHHAIINGFYCTVINYTTAGFVTFRNESGAARNFNVTDNSTITIFNSHYYFIVRMNNSWQSLYDFDTTNDGIQVGKRLDFTEFSSSQLNFRYTAYPTNQDQYYANAGNINALSTLQTRWTQFQAGSYQNQFFEITAPITLTSTEVAYFLNPTSFAPLVGTTYIIPQGSYIRADVNSNQFVWFASFEDFQGDLSVYSIHPERPWSSNSGTSLGDLGNTRKTQSLISIQPQDGPAGSVLPVGSSTYNEMPFRYLHYRRKQYEILPVPAVFQDEFPGARFINPFPGAIQAGEEVENYLQNSTNKLSVYTFANGLDNKELCCPPLDTSPPFDSSPIGLGTTNSEPDMWIGGLVNVRSISANHPDSKIHNIPSGQSTTSLPVDKKLEIVFGGVSYDLLISDSKPF